MDATGTTTQNIYHSLSPRAVKEIKAQRPELRVELTVALSAGGLPQTKGDFYTMEQGILQPGAALPSALAGQGDLRLDGE